MMVGNKDINKLPSELQFDIPGFITNHFYAIDTKKFFVRNVFIPEEFYFILEKESIALEGSSGKTKLYDVAKLFGYRFAMLSKLPKGNINKIAIHSVLKFFEIVYAKKFSIRLLDSAKKILELDAENFAMSKRDGEVGCTVISGAWGGMWCYLNGDYSLECSIKSITDDSCYVISGPGSVLEEMEYEVVRSRNYPEKVDFDSYMKNNKPEITYPESAASFKSLFEKKLMQYKPGRLIIADSDKRVVPIEISLLYAIEATVKEDLIYVAAYQVFYDIGSHIKKTINPYRFLEEIMTALGFGIIRVMESSLQIVFRGYPWFTEKSGSTSFAHIKGAVIGLLNSGTGEEYDVNAVSAQIVDGVFTVTLNLKKKI